MQQFTCPKCLQDYTDLTASLHSGCGTVEPPIESKPILDNADIQSAITPEIAKEVIPEVAEINESEETIRLSDTEIAKMVEANKEPIVINTIQATAETPEPKKRGRPAMNKDKIK